MTDKVVVITGGTKGIGRGIAERFLDAGAKVVVSARNPPETRVEFNGSQAVFIPANVRDAEALDALVSQTVDRLGRIDVLINNAGGSPFKEAAKASPRYSQAIIELNLIAPLNLSQKVNAIMQEQESGGTIINIASVSGTRPSPGTAAYGAAKAGIINLTKTLGVEWAPKVRVNTITAGLIQTEQALMHYGNENGIAAAASTVPMQRLGTANDVADACLFLASPLSSYMTGAELTIHGGGETPAFLTAVQAAMRG